MTHRKIKMRIDAISIETVVQTTTGYLVGVELELSDKDETRIPGTIEIRTFFDSDDYKWHYDLGELSKHVSTFEDKQFVHGVLTDEDFIGDIRTYLD